MKNIKTKAQLEDVVRAMCEISIDIALAGERGEPTSCDEMAMMNLWDKFDNLVAELES